jgi:competence protein ComEC
MTGDIDSTMERLLASHYGTGLKTDIVVMPHHGSSNTVYSLFFSYLRPQIAVISSGRGNSYGHPAKETTAMLAQLGIPFRNTAVDGTMLWKSNGFYWTTWF